MTRRSDAVLKKIADLGVKNPKQPTAAEIKMILDAYVRTKEIDVKSFEIYKGLIDSSLKTIFDGFSEFSKDETAITSATLDIIKQAMAILQGELDKDPTPEERRNILNHIFEFVREAREESKESRDFKKGILQGVVMVAGLVVAGVAYIVTVGRGGGHQRN